MFDCLSMQVFQASLIFERALLCKARSHLLTLAHKIRLNHRDETRVQMPAKMFPHLKLLCLLFMGPTLGFGHKANKQFFDQIWWFFKIKARF